MTSNDKDLFMLSIPSPGKFNADSINIELVAVEQLQAYNIYDLTNENIFELAMKDIEPENAVLISTKERYISYINWVTRTKGPKYVNIRLSKKKLPTLSFKEQLIILLRRFHPWKEDLNKLILRIEESGFLEAWGMKSLLADVSVNPNLDKYKDVEEKRLDIYMFIPFIIFLTIGLAIAKFIFIGEIFFLSAIFSRFENEMSPFLQRVRIDLIFISSRLRKKDKLCFIVAIHVCIIPLITFLYFLFKPESKFPAVVGEFRALSMPEMGTSQDAIAHWD